MAFGNITVKKADATTDIVYTGVQRSGGDKSPAQYRSNTVGDAVSHRPTLKIVGEWNAQRTARRIRAEYVYPEVVEGTDGRKSIANKALLTLEALIPQGMADTDIAEYAAQVSNLLGSYALKEALGSGYAAT